MTAAPEDRANSPTRARVIKRTDYTPEGGGAWVGILGGPMERSQLGGGPKVDGTNPIWAAEAG
jgi:hypothetical protein